MSANLESYQHNDIYKPTNTFGVVVNFSQNNTVRAGEVFTKTWRVMNLGNKPWKGKVMKCQENRLNPSLRVPHKKIIIPDTPVGGTAIISVIFKAPSYPCTAISEWQLVDEKPFNHSSFPSLRCSVNVFSAALLVG